MIGKVYNNLILAMSLLSISCIVIHADTLAGKPQSANWESIKTSYKLSILPNVIIGGKDAVLKIELAKPASDKGLDISITSSNESIKIPKKIHVEPGKTSSELTIKTFPVSANTPLGIQVTVAKTTIRTVATIKAPMVSVIRLHPMRVNKATDIHCTIKLTGPAPEEGVKVSLSTSDPSVKLPSEIIIGKNEDSIDVTGHVSNVTALTTVIVTASMNDDKIVRHAKLIIMPKNSAKQATDALHK